ncbi:lytic transglycosylase domain-containing protein [Candidatus Binatus sp.]|uniref:lytic transglycosylase domain-containing protein n=1 Tax=Candidatus Binatus sp. TaxID=2811406 RepID=UPI003C76DCAF
MGTRKAIIAAAVSMALLGAASAHAQQLASSRAENDRLFRAAAELYSIDPDLLAAIASVESGGNSDAVSPKGAQGLMQLMPATATRFGVIDPFDPVSNTLGAVRFISFLRQYRTAHGDGAPLSLVEMIAAYNAGEAAVDKYNGVPPYPETQQYVRKVLIAYLFRNSRSPLAERLGARPAPPADSAVEPIRAKPATGNSHPAMTQQKSPAADSIDKLTEIQRLRQVELSKHQQTASRAGEPDGQR